MTGMPTGTEAGSGTFAKQGANLKSTENVMIELLNPTESSCMM